jgi:hypothetical protein
VLKKIIAVILAFLYLSTSTDAAITIHYCMGKLYAIDLAHNDHCGKCGMKKMDGCCKDVVKLVKIQDKHQLSSKPATPLFTSALPAIQYIIISESAYPKTNSQKNLHSNSPPVGAVPLIILHSVFLI